MRRRTAAVVGTVAGTALMALARIATPPTTAAPASSVATADLTDPGGTGATQSPTPGEGPSASAGVTTSPGQSGGPVAAGPSGAATAPSTSAGTVTAGTGLRNGTYPGLTVAHKYGTLRVTITVSSGRIASISESYVTDIVVSERINQDALPKLRQEALQAQSARIDTVSGATYTSDAYRTSLQAAIDAARG